MIGRLRERRGRVGPRTTTSAASQFWRAAAFILVAGNLVFAYIAIELYRDNLEIAKLVIQGNGMRQAERLVGGESFRNFVTEPNSPRHQRVLLSSPTDPGVLAVVHVRFNTDTMEHDLYVRTEGLAEGTDYVLTAVGADGKALELAITTGGGPLGFFRAEGVDVTVLQATNLRWEITDLQQDQLMLGSMTA